MDISVRTGSRSDLTFLRLMLYEAAYWRPEERPPIDMALANPELSKLLSGWGRQGDLALIAEDRPISVGAVWIRYWTDENHSYGFVAADVPELSIGIVKSYRFLGIGRLLLMRLLKDIAPTTPQVSLSVEATNPALGLYRSMGFKVVDKVANSFTMVVNTSDA